MNDLIKEAEEWLKSYDKTPNYPRDTVNFEMRCDYAEEIIKNLISELKESREEVDSLRWKISNHQGIRHE